MGLLNANSLNEWITGIPDRAKEAYRGLLNAPDEIRQLFDPQFQQGLLRRIEQEKRNPKPFNTSQAVGMGMDLVQPFGGIAGHIVYHGSPHKFDKFDMSKIGTGEGAQAYGHGLYFSENPKVAATYKPAIEITKEDARKSIAELRRQLENANTEAGTPPTGWTQDEYIDWFRKSRIDAINYIEKTVAKGETGALYKVDIPDESIPRMLDWDAKLSEQPESVITAIDSLGKIYKKGSGPYTYDYFPKDYTGKDIYKALSISDQASTLKMKELGIPGIRYLDGGSRGAGAGTSNFVLFDDQLPRILEINGQPTGLLSWADEAKKAKKK